MASFLSRNPSLFASSFTNSAASSSVFVAGAALGEVCAPAGSDVIKPAALNIANTRPDPTNIFLACMWHSYEVMNGNRNRGRLQFVNQIACQ